MRSWTMLALTVCALAHDESEADLKPDIAYITEHFVPLNGTLKSGEFNPSLMNPASSRAGTFLLWDVVVTAEQGAPYTQLFFDPATTLSDADVDAATLKLWSAEDGAVQLLNAHTIRHWGFKSATFNGDTVHLQLLATNQADVVNVGVLGAVVGGKMDGPQPCNLCTGRDRRQRAHWKEDFRYNMGGSMCSGGLMTIRGGQGLTDGCMLTAGHCRGTGRVEFNVPESGSGGQIRFPPPEDQYPIDSSSIQTNPSGVGNDWKYMGAFPNSNTGRTALEVQVDSHVFQVGPSQSPPAPYHHFGHGITNPVGPLSLALKGTPGGGTGQRQQNTMRYRFDTTSGDSGSAVEDDSGLYVAIHTHGGCSPNNPNSHNIGTWVGRTEIQTAVRNGRGVCSQKGLEAAKAQRYGIHFRGNINAFDGPHVTF